MKDKMKALEDLKFNINEIFYSIQGEGTRVGLPFVFIRLQGCLLRCVWCDTPYALERKEIATIMNGKELWEAMKQYDCKRIMLTGGEPLEQEDIFEFITYLCDEDYEVVIETNGQVDTEEVDNRAIKIIDIKCPGSKMHKKNNYNNLEIVKNEDEIKFVVMHREDFDFAVEICKKYELYTKVNTVLFSPVFGTLDANILAKWILDEHIPVRMQLQLHKFIWEPNTRGV